TWLQKYLLLCLFNKSRTRSAIFMKKKLLIILLIIVLFIGGYFVLNEFKKKRLVNEAQEKAEIYVIQNYENIDSVQIATDNYELRPMGTLGVGGRLNNTEHLTFYITFLIENTKVGVVQTIVEASDSPDRKDGECGEICLNSTCICFRV